MFSWERRQQFEDIVNKKHTLNIYQSIKLYFVIILLDIKYSSYSRIFESQKKSAFHQIELYGLTQIRNTISVFDASFNFTQTLLIHFLRIDSVFFIKKWIKDQARFFYFILSGPQHYLPIPTANKNRVFL
jgi:hypothetical protein